MASTSRIYGCRVTSELSVSVQRRPVTAVCRISRIEEDCFMELSTLEWLKLNNNELRSLPYTLMEPVLMSLKYIDVYSECHGIIIYMLDILTQNLCCREPAGVRL